MTCDIEQAFAFFSLARQAPGNRDSSVSLFATSPRPQNSIYIKQTIYKCCLILRVGFMIFNS